MATGPRPKYLCLGVHLFPWGHRTWLVVCMAQEAGTVFCLGGKHTTHQTRQTARKLTFHPGPQMGENKKETDL
jgi:hypothetical protein